MRGERYAWAILMYEIATSERPWADLDRSAVAKLLVEGARPTFDSTANNNLPVWSKLLYQAILDPCWLTLPLHREKSFYSIGLRIRQIARAKPAVRHLTELSSVRASVDSSWALSSSDRPDTKALSINDEDEETLVAISTSPIGESPNGGDSSGIARNIGTSDCDVDSADPTLDANLADKFAGTGSVIPERAVGHELSVAVEELNVWHPFEHNPSGGVKWAENPVCGDALSSNDLSTTKLVLSHIGQAVQKPSYEIQSQFQSTVAIRYVYPSRQWVILALYWQ